MSPAGEVDRFNRKFGILWHDARGIEGLGDSDAFIR